MMSPAPRKVVNCHTPVSTLQQCRLKLLWTHKCGQDCPVIRAHIPCQLRPNPYSTDGRQSRAEHERPTNREKGPSLALITTIWLDIGVTDHVEPWSVSR